MMKLSLPPSKFSPLQQGILFLIAAAVTFGVGYASSVFMRGGDRSWYDKMKPKFTPPDIVFKVVWPVLFVLLAISLFLTLRLYGNNAFYPLFALYILNLVLIFLWTPTFYKWRNFPAAFAEIVAMIAVSLAIIALHVKKTGCMGAAVMMVPYVLWLMFAAVLNGTFLGQTTMKGS